METKTCGRCREEKTLDLFYKMKVGVKGVDGYCIECRKVKNAEYNQKARTQKTEYMRQFRAVKKAKRAQQLDFK